MKENVMILYDGEEEYAQLMSDFLRSHRDTPWEVRTYTSEEELLEEEKENDIAVLVIAESVYSDKLDVLNARQRILLNESGVIRWGQMPNISKYQEAEKVLKELLSIYVNIAQIAFPKLQQSSRTTFVGIYSPIRRCNQTSVALSMCQMLGLEGRTLYLNFEHYVGITELIPDEQERDLADLLYFLSSDQERFRLRLQTIVQRKGNLEYVPPMKSGQNLITISQEEWIQLLQKIEELEEYRYVVLDLSESMQGLFEIMRLCNKIITLTRDDRISQCKMAQYEQLLQLYEYEDVLQKTSKHGVPRIYRFPGELEQYTKGELADFVRMLVEEMTADAGKPAYVQEACANGRKDELYGL